MTTNDYAVPSTGLTVNEYLAANAARIDWRSAMVIQELTPVDWDAVTQAARNLTGRNKPGVDCRLRTLRSTFGDFDRPRMLYWRGRGYREALRFAGLRAVKYTGVQVYEQDQPITLIVVDAGDIRICLTRNWQLAAPDSWHLANDARGRYWRR